MKVLARDSVDILDLIKICLIDRTTKKATVDLENFDKSDDKEMAILSKLKELIEKKKLDIDFVNNNGKH